jgi:hypothetical protein
MESKYDLNYDRNTREFKVVTPIRDKDMVDIFGYILNRHFYYGDYSTEYVLNELFGNKTNELLLDYLREKFPNIEIEGIE